MTPIQDPCVTVVVPSYNRGHILSLTLPSYLQPEVGELILVDDCSTDNTLEVVHDLMKTYPRIRYMRNEVNMKQTGSKNRGITEAKFPYVFFGDDDSVLRPGSIGWLLQTLQGYQADIVGARALYMTLKDQWIHIDDFVRDRYRSDIKQIVDLTRMAIDFSFSYKEPVEVPVTHACFLIRHSVASQIQFDLNYKGNAYREETDFVVRASLAGYKVMYDSRAVQVNLPPCMVRGGGAHSGTAKWWYESAVQNNDYFLSKNYAAMQEKWNLPYSIEQMREFFLQELKAKKKAECWRKWLKRMGVYYPLRFVKRLFVR